MYRLGTTSLRDGAQLCLNRPPNRWETVVRFYLGKVPVAGLKASCSGHRRPVLNVACSQLCGGARPCDWSQQHSARFSCPSDPNKNENLNKSNIRRAAAGALGPLGEFYLRELTHHLITDCRVVKSDTIKNIRSFLDPLSDHLPVFPSNYTNWINMNDQCAAYWDS